MKIIRIAFLLMLLNLLAVSDSAGCGLSCQKKKSPRIVNIINFIRQLEPRDASITEDVLYETVHQQIIQLNKYDLPATFLLQYDALINPQYQSLLKNELNNHSEVGGWWEITQPHVEAAGMKWRGKYPWDWHADVGFATGYTPEEREILVDVYMEKFKSVFGKYPSSVGSWFIDAHTLGYMYDKYGIVASCNCKDQVGTDGYTLWGGYWNQAYYPSRKNAYMPAQTELGQIPVPIFRMLGSDPIYQYDLGLGSNIQGVLSLEPVYPDAGGNREWVEWFFRTMFDEPCLAFNYVQAGQENSFTWQHMQKGLEIQIPLLDSLRKQNKIRVETLEESGKWFKKNFQLTPATAVTAMTDVREEGHKTVWYNSRFYRANLLWNGNSFRFRDIHLFDERLESDYLRKAGTSNQCLYTTLPFVDGFLWSTQNDIAGLRFMEYTGTLNELFLSDPVVRELGKNVLEVKCSTKDGKLFRIIFKEDRFEVLCDYKATDFSWVLELRVASDFRRSLPFRSIDRSQIEASINGFDYKITCEEGAFVDLDKNLPTVFYIVPDDNKLIIKTKQ